MDGTFSNAIVQRCVETQSGIDGARVSSSVPGTGYCRLLGTVVVAAPLCSALPRVPLCKANESVAGNLAAVSVQSNVVLPLRQKRVIKKFPAP